MVNEDLGHSLLNFDVTDSMSLAPPRGNCVAHHFLIEERGLFCSLPNFSYVKWLLARYVALNTLQRPFAEPPPKSATSSVRQSASTKYSLFLKRDNLRTLGKFLRNDLSIPILFLSLLYHVFFFLAFAESEALTDLAADLINQPAGLRQVADTTAALAPPNNMLQLSPCKILLFNGFLY